MIKSFLAFLIHHSVDGFYLNKIDNSLSIKPKRLINRMFSSILAVLFLIRLKMHYFCNYILVHNDRMFIPFCKNQCHYS